MGIIILIWFYFKLEKWTNRQSFVILSQWRVLDKNRFVKKIWYAGWKDLTEINSSCSDGQFSFNKIQNINILIHYTNLICIKKTLNNGE